MEDLSKLEADVLATADALEKTYGQHGPWEQQHFDAMQSAVRALRAAREPKPMTPDDAWEFVAKFSTLSAGIKALLDECRRRDWLVLDKALKDVGYMGDADVPDTARNIARRVLGQEPKP